MFLSDSTPRFSSLWEDWLILKSSAVNVMKAGVDVVFGPRHRFGKSRPFCRLAKSGPCDLKSLGGNHSAAEGLGNIIFCSHRY